ncbi:MAG: hypothetical protein EON54_09310 [Alcaligenaceae bacterium]|nr:MAG: hypothetical protein EON54_09310 [Alcaligenaceae bacterium]
MSKQLEQEAFGHLERYLKEQLPDCVLENHMNKGGGHSDVVGDAILRYRGKCLDIEIKASSKEPNGNLRLTHQTVTKAIGRNVIVALVSKLATGKPTFEFFRLTDVVENLRVEPHFIIMKKHTNSKMLPIPALLELPDAKLDIEVQLNSKVRSYMHKRLWDAGALVDEAEQDEQESRTFSLARLSMPDEPITHVRQLPSSTLWSPFESSFDKVGDRHPPWLKYPNMPRTSMGWRMGEGEDYAEEFSHWLSQLTTNELRAYRKKYPAPSDWSNIWPVRRSDSAG